MQTPCCRALRHERSNSNDVSTITLISFSSETHLEEDSRSLLQEHAIQLGLDMFSLLVERCVELFKIHLSSPDYPKTMFSEDLHAIYPSVKVWCDWMLCHAPLWNPPPIREMDYG